ncbi:hypothetical protein D9M71_474840 [compost metagenome]
MGQVAARLFQQLLDVLHRLLGLGARVAEPYQAAFEISAYLATHIDGVACAHGLAEVIVQALVRIGIFGIEHADAGMGRHQLTSIILVI